MARRRSGRRTPGCQLQAPPRHGRPSRAPRPHPFAAAPDVLADALADALAGTSRATWPRKAVDDEITLRLPSTLDGPLASPELSFRPPSRRRGAVRRRRLSLAAWRVPVLVFEPAAAPSLLARARRACTGRHRGQRLDRLPGRRRAVRRRSGRARPGAARAGPGGRRVRRPLAAGAVRRRRPARPRARRRDAARLPRRPARSGRAPGPLLAEHARRPGGRDSPHPVAGCAAARAQGPPPRPHSRVSNGCVLLSPPRCSASRWRTRRTSARRRNWPPRWRDWLAAAHFRPARFAPASAWSSHRARPGARGRPAIARDDGVPGGRISRCSRRRTRACC